MENWEGDITKAKGIIGWSPDTSLETGLAKTRSWIEGLGLGGEQEEYGRSSKKFRTSEKRSTSLILICHAEVLGLREAISKLMDELKNNAADFELIIVSDGANEGVERIILEQSQQFRKIIGIVHSRCFGKEASYFSAMEIASKASCILLEYSGDTNFTFLAELINKWNAGFEVVYGVEKLTDVRTLRGVIRSFLHFVYTLIIPLSLPVTSSDICLLDSKVVKHLLTFPERTLYMKGLRTYAGFRQIGVEIPKQPKVIQGATGLVARFSLAKIGILSFSNFPINVLSGVGALLFLGSALIGSIFIIAKFLYPAFAPSGITTILLTIGFFGSLNLIGLSLVGEYVGNIFSEAKKRPRFIRDKIIVGGVSRSTV